MDTPFSNLSPEEFDAWVALQNAPDPSAPQASHRGEKQVSEHLTQALAWSLELAPQVMTNLVSRALQSMDRKTISLAGTPQEPLLEAAAAELDAQRARWAKQYAALLRVAMAYPAPAKMASLLPLVDLRICAAEIQELESLVKSQGGPRNPLAPASYVQALLELIARCEAPAEFRQIWADHLLAALSSQLAWVYLQLHAALRDPSQREPSAVSLADDFQAYAAQAYGFAVSGEQQQAADLGNADQAETIALAEQARRTVQQLRQHLGLAAEPERDLARALQGNPMEALLNDLDQAEKLMAEIQGRGMSLPDLDADSDFSQKSAAAPDDSSMEEHIDTLIETYQNTTSPSLQRIPPQLRNALEDLKPALLILMRNGDDVATNVANPARQFLDLICQRSMRYSSEVADGFSSFIEPVQKLINSIANMQYVNARVFEKASAKLTSYWQSRDEKEAQQQAYLAQEEERMLSTKQLAGRLGFELIGRKDAGDAPPSIKQFLMGPWAQVLARAQLFPRESSDPQRYAQTTAALLWSVSVRRASPRKAEHIALIMDLTAQLQAGLQSINMPEGEAQELLAEITKMHDAVQGSPAIAGLDGEPAPRLL